MASAPRAAAKRSQRRSSPNSRSSRMATEQSVSPEDVCEITITAPDREWLIDLCRQLVDARLAASAHVVHPIASFYRRQGAVREATEARGFLRSRISLVDELATYVVERHPSEVPSITAVPVIGGNPEYLAWLRRET